MSIRVNFMITASQDRRLRALAKRTDRKQSEYVREAIEWVLAKYGGERAAKEVPAPPPEPTDRAA